MSRKEEQNESQGQPDGRKPWVPVLVWVAVLSATAMILVILCRLAMTSPRLKLAEPVQHFGKWALFEPDGIERTGRLGLFARDGDRLKTFQASGVRMRLNDDSPLIIDTDSELVFSMEGDSRIIELTGGRALFALAPRHGPYLIKAAAVRIPVTRAAEFELTLGTGRLDVMVLTGELELNREGVEPLTLKSGQRVRIGGETLKPEDVLFETMRRRLSWSTRLGVLLPDTPPTGDAPLLSVVRHH